MQELPEDFYNATVTLILTNGQIALVDFDLYHELAAHKWSAQKGRYAYRGTGNGKNEILHRRINKTPVGFDTDHKNGFGLDCRRSNLRTATHSQNIHNSEKERASFSSRFKGVRWSKQHKKWRADIRSGNGRKHIGLFSDEESAARAYDAELRKIAGEFGRTNFPL